MLHLIWTHVDLGRERKIVVDFASLKSTEVEIESLQMKDQIIWNIFEAGSEWMSANLLLFGG